MKKEQRWIPACAGMTGAKMREEGWIQAVVYPHEDGGGNDARKDEGGRMDSGRRLSP